MIDHRIHVTDIESDPNLLWGHKDSFDLDYAHRQTSAKHPADFNGFNHLYLFYLAHGGKACFYRDTECVLEFNLEH